MIELHRWESGGGPAVLCVHETAATGEVWRPLARSLGERARTIAYDRRGWGRSEAPRPYTRTTIEEQSEDAALLLERLGAGPAVLCGAGLGAVAALDLLIRRPELARGAVLVEPPLLAFLPEATEGLSEDGVALREAIAEGGPAAGLDLYLSGRLAALGPGADRLPEAIAASARERPLTLFAELAAVPAWSLPVPELVATSVEVRIAVAASTPPLVRRSCEALAARISGAGLEKLAVAGLPADEGADQLAGLVLELL